MRDKSRQELAKFCESWWAKLGDSAKIEQNQFAEQLLGALGWEHPEPLQSKANWTKVVSASYILRGPAGTAVAAHFVMPGALEPPGSLVERGLDFCQTTRILVSGTHALNIPYAFITDVQRSYLYDTHGDELLLHADMPTEFSAAFPSVLSRTDIERGALEEVRRQPRSFVARQLREWCLHWTAQLCAENPGLSEGAASLAIDRLLVLRFLFYHNILKRADWDFPRRFGGLVVRAMSHRPEGCGQGLIALSHELWTQWKAGLFAPAPALDAVLANDAIAVPMLRECTLLSRTKFTIATILESFNYGDPAEKARVRMVPGSDEERETRLAKCTPEAVDAACFEIDLQEEGYRAIFHWFDKLVNLYRRLDIEYDTRTASLPVPDGLDLLAWADRAAARPRALADPLNYAADHGLRFLHASERQLRTGRLVLYLHLISRYHQTQERLAQFPEIEKAFARRAKVIEADRKWMARGQNSSLGESEVV